MYQLELETETILLATWLKGKHREDISLFDAKIFKYVEAFNDIKKGITTAEYTARHEKDITTAELLRTTDKDGNFITNADYIGARNKALLMQRNKAIEETKRATKEEKIKLDKEIEKLNAVIYDEEIKKKTSNYTMLVFEDMQNKATEKKVLYGKGLTFLDKYTGGIHRGQLTTVGARTGIGKSAFTLQVAYNVAQQGYKVLYIPLEMTATETLERLLRQQQIIESEENLEKPTDAITDNIENFLTELENKGNFIIYEDLYNLKDIETKIKEEQPYLVVIDQLTQVEPTERSQTIRERYLQCTRKIKRLALENNIAIILVAQVNRASTDKTKPGIQHLSESDNIGQDSDNVLLLYTENDKENESQRLTTLEIAKQRNGISGKEIPLMYNGNKFLFSPVDTRQDTRKITRI